MYLIVGNTSAGNGSTTLGCQKIEGAPRTFKKGNGGASAEGEPFHKKTKRTARRGGVEKQVLEGGKKV